MNRPVWMKWHAHRDCVQSVVTYASWTNHWWYSRSYIVLRTIFFVINITLVRTFWSNLKVAKFCYILHRFSIWSFLFPVNIVICLNRRLMHFVPSLGFPSFLVTSVLLIFLILWLSASVCHLLSPTVCKLRG